MNFSEWPSWLYVVAGVVGVKLLDLVWSIVANLLTPQADGLIKLGLKSVTTVRADNIAHRIRLVEAWVERPTLLILHLVNQAAMFLFGALGAFATFMFSNRDIDWWQLLVVVTSTAALIAAWFLIDVAVAQYDFTYPQTANNRRFLSAKRKGLPIEQALESKGGGPTAEHFARQQSDVANA